MKRLLRSVSLLLAGLMTMALFTACSTDTASALGEQYVQAYIDGFNSIRTTEPLSEDPTLKARCLELLENIDPATGTVSPSEYSIWEDYENQRGFTIHIDIEVDGYTTDENGNYSALVVTEDAIAELKASYERIPSNGEYAQRASNSLGIAAAYKVINGKTYVAVATI